MIELSVIIVNWNLCELIKECIHSLHSTIKDMTFEIIVVDNASSDNSVEMLKQDFPEVITVTNNKNIGFGKANNQACKMSQGKYLLLLNPDATVLPTSVEKMLHILKTQEEVGLVGPKILNSDDTIQKACLRKYPSLIRELQYLLRLDRFLTDKRLLTSGLNYEKAQEANVISGSCMLLSRDVFEQSGRFDERFFMYGEDVDLCRSVWESGWKVLYYHKAVVQHNAHSASKKSKQFSPAAVACKSMYLYFKKHEKFPTAQLYRTLVFVTSLIWLIVFTLSLQFMKRKPIRSLSMYHDYHKMIWAICGNFWVAEEKEAS